MCSTNPGNWVTFDDDPTFQSSQKSKNFPLENQGICRPNGLKLNLSGAKEFPSGSSSTSSTPLSSPIIDFYFSPGPPSNSPLSTPTKDFPGFPGIPKAGTHVLYPIPESSSNSPLTTATGSSSLATKPTCFSQASLPSDHSCIHPASKVGLADEMSPHQAEGFQSDTPQFQYFREDCAFSSPFWKDEGSASQLTFDPPGSRKIFPSRDKEVPLDACRFELMRFKTSHSGEDLPFSLKSVVVVQGAYVELQAFVNMAPLVQRPSHAGSLRSCDNIMIHFPVPSQWIKALWTMNLQRQKSLKAKMNRRACLGSLHELESEPVIQVTVGSAKYESAYRAVVWKIDRLPDKNSSPDHPHCLSYKLELGSDQEIPSDWYPFATIQFGILDTTASRTEVRSLGVESDVQPQKHIHHRACYNIQVEIEKKWIKIDGEDPDKAGDCVTQ